ncbi:TGA transcription factor [Parasponia andersonii]|uniref:TGA transcription factor n=1 Tax=Parasponia andersonii TaxID=3476 RepID=A0A2P5BH11_PARAD|nr:TGA transcription factor [Parasponia andersonii]
MKSHFSRKHFEEGDFGQRKKDGFTLSTEDDGEDETDCLAETFNCISLHRRDPTKQEVSLEKYGRWRQEQKNRAAKLEKQLKARWELEELIEEQLNSFHAHYNRSMVPNQLKDIPQLLMPKWAPTYELAAMSWLGDWRPSAILDLVLILVRSLPSSLPSYTSDSPGAEQLLSQFIHEIRIEETIIDEEMAEIQATCILHLPFGPMNIKPGGTGGALACVQSVFKNIERVITKAQELRFKALELVLKKVLSHIDAAEFLVAFQEIQDSIHQFAVNHRRKRGPVSVPFKALGST